MSETTDGTDAPGGSSPADDSSSEPQVQEVTEDGTGLDQAEPAEADGTDRVHVRLDVWALRDSEVVVRLQISDGQVEQGLVTDHRHRPVKVGCTEEPGTFEPHFMP
jgi:hypothetical protein